MTTEAGTSPAEPTIAEAWHELTERWTVRELVAYAQMETAYCCQVGCGGGGCESCPCCHAGYCVSGLDGVPTAGSDLNPNDDQAHAAEVYRNWLEIAAEHNPVAASLSALSKVEQVATAFVAQREEYVRVLKQCVEADADYYRWQGHAEARRQLRDKLAACEDLREQDAKRVLDGSQ